MSEKMNNLQRVHSSENLNSDRIIQIPEQYKAYYNKLVELQSAAEPFPLSHSGENTDLDSEAILEVEKKYAEVLEPYQIPLDRIDKEKNDFLETPTTAHKLHLNIALTDVKKVSEYLMKEGFFHKYLRSGEAATGSMFTVYIGSKDLTDQLAIKISNELGSTLKKPVDHSEIEYAPNVIGRFTVADEVNKFTHYGFGIRGFPMLKKFASRQMLGRVKDMPNKLQDKQFKEGFDESYDSLAKMYGSYFYGTGK